MTLLFRISVQLNVESATPSKLEQVPVYYYFIIVSIFQVCTIQKTWLTFQINFVCFHSRL